MAKRHIQACEIDGSLYGKKRTTAKKSMLSKKTSRKKNNLINEYSHFYKKQASIMDKMFRNGS